MTLLFKRALAEQVAAGEKTVTRRLVSDNPRSPWWRERCRLQPGTSVAVLGGFDRPALCRVQIVGVTLGPLGYLTDLEAMREGFARQDGLSPAMRFENTWTAITGSYDPTAEVWRVEFRPLPAGEESTHG